jgi:GntR family transcriptional regulator
MADSDSIGTSDAIGRQASLATLTRDALLRGIIQGDFPDNRLPAENELCARFEVSRTTIRSAVQALERDGLVVRRQGVGTLINHHVKPARLGLHRMAGFQTLLEESGHRVTVDIDAAVSVPAPEVAGRLAIAADTPCYVLNKIFYAEERPAIALRDHIPVVYLRQIPPDSAIPSNLYDFFATYCTARVDHALVELSPRSADAETAASLGLAIGTPHLELSETHYTSAASPVAFSRVHVNDDFVRFDVIRR